MSAVIEAMRIPKGDRVTFFQETGDLDVIVTSGRQKAPSLRGLLGPAKAGSVLVRLDIEHEGSDVVIVESSRSTTLRTSESGATTPPPRPSMKPSSY